MLDGIVYINLSGINLSGFGDSVTLCMHANLKNLSR